MERPGVEPPCQVMPWLSVLQRGNADAPVPFRIDFEERLLADDGRAFDLGVGRLGPLARGRMRDADEDHVPVGAGPAAPLAVARDPLLLRACADVAVDERVGHPSAAGPSAFLVQNDVAEHVHAAEGHGLRDGPLHRAAGGRDGKAFDGAPEGAGGVVAREAGVGVDVAGDVDGVGCGAEAEHLGVEADGDVDVVFAGQEEQRVASRAEFAVLLDRVDLVDLRLDVGGRHGGIEEENVGAEVGAQDEFCGCGGSPLQSRSEREKTQDGCDEGNRDVEAGSNWSRCRHCPDRSFEILNAMT